jgi:hypothetical protein
MSFPPKRGRPKKGPPDEKKNARYIRTQLDEMPEAAELIDRIEALSRSEAIRKAAKQAGEIVAADARPRITPPGYPGDKPDKKPLRDSIRVVVREYPGVTLMLIGASYPHGSHGHLVEYGHIQTLKDGSTIQVAPRPWLRPAVESTRDAQRAAVLEGLRKAVTG